MAKKKKGRLTLVVSVDEDNCASVSLQGDRWCRQKDVLVTLAGYLCAEAYLKNREYGLEGCEQHIQRQSHEFLRGRVK